MPSWRFVRGFICVLRKIVWTLFRLAVSYAVRAISPNGIMETRCSANALQSLRAKLLRLLSSRIQGSMFPIVVPTRDKGRGRRKEETGGGCSESQEGGRGQRVRMGPESVGAQRVISLVPEISWCRGAPRETTSPIGALRPMFTAWLSQSQPVPHRPNQNTKKHAIDYGSHARARKAREEQCPRT